MGLQLSRSMGMSYWKAHSHGLHHFVFAKGPNALLTLGADELGGPVLLKAWHLGRLEKGAPFCSRLSKVPMPNGKPTKVTILPQATNRIIQ